MTIAVLSPSLSPGWGSQSKIIEKQTIDTQVQLKKALAQPASNQPILQVLQALSEICQKYATADWDGCGALPILDAAQEEATNLLFMLDEKELPMPEISPEVDGGIELEWYKSATFVFTVSVNGNGVLGYSAYYGEKSRNYGTEPSSMELPETIHQNISKFI